MNEQFSHAMPNEMAEGLSPCESGRLSNFWMPFTDNRYFKSSPRLFDSAQGMHYYTTDGAKVLDGTAGLWCVNAGHGQELITKAIQAQAAFFSDWLFSAVPTFQLSRSCASRSLDAGTVARGSR